MNQRPDNPEQPAADPDPLDREAADIDPRSDEAVEEIEDLIETAEDLGRDPDQEVTTDPDPAP